MLEWIVAEAKCPAFRAKATEAKLTVSDWPESGPPAAPIGQEQAFNFIEIQPYHE